MYTKGHYSKHISHIFINDVDDGTECTFIQFANDTKLGGAADGPEDCAAIQKDSDRLEEWPDRNHV